MSLRGRRRRRPAAGGSAASPPSEQELQITHGLQSLREASVREVMTPRVDVVALPTPVRLSDVVAAVRRSGHSHFPVYRDDPDRLVGVLFLKDLFSLELAGSGRSGEEEASRWAGLGAEGPEPDLTRRVREPYVVPETRSALEVLAEMRRRRRGFAVVVDEYGGFAGVLTVNDLVSELVGDLRDEFDRATSPAILRIDANRFLVDGACTVNEVNDEIGIELPEGEYVTLGGYLFDALGHIPVEGEAVEHQGWRLRVTRMDRRRIAKVVVQAPSATMGEAAGTASGS